MSRIPINTSDIERALADLGSQEEGTRFQRLAVLLARQTWSELIPCERKKDLGLDAYAASWLSPGGIGKGLACSTTAGTPNIIRKIRSDAAKVRENYADVKILIFATPEVVTQRTKREWEERILDEFGYSLVVLSREVFISDLLNPANASICRTLLRIDIPYEDSETELLERAVLAASAVTESWITHRRLVGRPIIALQAIKLNEAGKETDGILSEDDIYNALKEGSRVVLEAPAGRGKTTTLIELAKRNGDAEVITFLIDLPAWIRSQRPIFEYIAASPQYRSQSVNADALSKLGAVARCLLLLNGWNEVSEPGEAARALMELDRDLPAAGIIVATRTHYVSPPLPGSFRAKLLPLNRSQRSEYLKLSLGSQAEELGSKLARDPVLDDLTRTPLFLAEVTTIFGSGEPIPATKMGILGAVIRLMEQLEEHRNSLQGQPLTGHASDYLSELAHQMKSLGEVAISDEEARRAAYSVSNRLRNAGQIATLPEPASVLDALCAHHVLERFDYPRAEFWFEHQQFQEFYAASLLRRQLTDALRNDDQKGIRRFVRQYVNEPRWEEPLLMIAEEIGIKSSEVPANADLLLVGKTLVEETLTVDPFFSAQLSRRCGLGVWNELKDVVSARLRAWYSVADASHRECALVAMLATGFDDFADIIVPLLTSDDQQVWLATYRAAGEFRVSSLGAEWHEVVSGWKEEMRVTFVVELIHNRREIEAAVRLALADPSSRVRLAASEALGWAGSEGDMTQLLSTLDAKDFDTVVSRLPVERIPSGMKDRAIAVYRSRLTDTPDTVARLRVMLALRAAGVQCSSERWKEELTHLQPGRLEASVEPVIETALDVVKKTDPQWVSHWVASRIVEGSLWSERWIHLVTSIPGSLKDTLLERLSGEELQFPREESDAVAVLAATVDASLAAAAFAKLRSVRSGLSLDGAGNEARWAIRRQLEGLVRALPVATFVDSFSNCFGKGVDQSDFTVIIESLSAVARKAANLREELPEGMRQELRSYLKAGIPLVLSQEDPIGQMKANLVSALASLAQPQDMADLRQLIRADIERVRRGRAARARGERNEMASGASHSYANWNVRAIVDLDGDAAEEVLVELLQEPEYERDAAQALLLLAKHTKSDDRVDYRKDYGLIWEARAKQQVVGFNEERRQRSASALKRQTLFLLRRVELDEQLEATNFRLKHLAKVLATLDPLDSSQLVMEVLALTGHWDGWERVAALEALLFGGSPLPAEETFAVLDPTIKELHARLYETQDNLWLFRRCLCILPFVDPPSAGIEKLRDMLSNIKIPQYELREVVTALGYCRCNEGLTLLRELACTTGGNFREISREWIDAVATTSTLESRELLMSFVDPTEKGLGCEIEMDDYSSDLLALRLADMARADDAAMRRILQLCELQQPARQRLLLSKVVAQLGNPDAVLVGLNLISDNHTPSIPYDLERAIEGVFLERRPYGQTGSFTLSPRDSNQIRARLFHMVMDDDQRSQSAFGLLGRIEVWRLNYGRPRTESRHPAFDSGEPWPPLKGVDR